MALRGALRRSALRKIRGRELVLIGQEPELALNPVLTVGQQVVEVLRAHVRGDVCSHRERARFIRMGAIGFILLVLAVVLLGTLFVGRATVTPAGRQAAMSSHRAHRLTIMAGR